MIDNLLKHPKLWRANQLSLSENQDLKHCISTGFTELDAHLPGGGWPNAALVDVMMASAGIGELRLFIPALKALSESQQRWLTWVSPPFTPYAPALQRLGVDIKKILLIHPRTHQEALWAVERACKSGTCSTVFAWLDEKKLNFKDTQRLQIAAKQGGTLACLFRPQTQHTSMAELRLLINGLSSGELHMAITKRRGGWPIDNISLPLAEVTQSQFTQSGEVHQQLQLWRTGRDTTAPAPYFDETHTLHHTSPGLSRCRLPLSIRG